MGKVVAIDGPAGAGKSTVARRLADRLGWAMLDTGAMYRAVALAALRSGISLDHPDELTALAERLNVSLPPGKVLLNEEDVTLAIRQPEVSQASSRVAVCLGVRARLAVWQRAFAADRDTVTEGRDQGTVVFPDALRKFFVTASPEARAQRRCLEYESKGQTVDTREVLREILERDARDAGRDVAPMKPAPDALILDTTGLTTDRVLELVTQCVLDPSPQPWRLEGGERRTPGYFASLWTAWNPEESRLLAIGKTREDAARAARTEAGEPAPLVDRVDS